jgi:hypothetical protein
MQSQNFKPRDPKTPLDVDIDNIAYDEEYDEDLEHYKLEEIIEVLSDLPSYGGELDEWDECHLSEVMD